MKRDKPPNRPIPEDFGLAEATYERAKSLREYRCNTVFEDSPWFWGMIIAGLLGIASFGGYFYLRWQYAGLCGIVLTVLSHAVKVVGKRAIAERAKACCNDPTFEKVRLYDEAMARYEQALADHTRMQHEYWRSLRGTDLENELARLYRRLGYLVDTTRATGDGGIDLILKKNGDTTIVQCKGHAKPVGVGVARDLYGTLMDFGAKRAVLACPAGFTAGVVAFAQDKPIDLVSVSELVAMAGRVRLAKAGTGPTHVPAKVR